jgi:hypothetical protein
MNGSKIFEFSFNGTISSTFKNSLECILSDSRIIQANLISSSEFNCVISSDSHLNVTFWYRNEQGERSKLSSNFISLYFFKFGSISFNDSTSQFGNTLAQYRPIIKLNSANIPKEYSKQVSCHFDGSLVQTVTQNDADLFECTVSSSSGGFKTIGMRYIERNAYKIPNIHNTFYHRINVTYSFGALINLDLNLFLQVFIDTNSLISSGKMKSNCDDLIVTFKGNEIEMEIMLCNTVSTRVRFKIQDSQNSTSDDYRIFYGNNEAIAKVITTSGTTYSFIPSLITDGNEKVFSLNSNHLEFGFLKLFSINKIDPVAALTTNTSISLWNNYEVVNYNEKIQFLVRFGSEEFFANFTNQLFISNIYVKNGRKINLGVFAKYLPTNEYVQASSNFIDFIFTDKIPLYKLSPFIDRFSKLNEQKNTTVVIKCNNGLFTDIGLYCKYNHRGIIKYSVAKFVLNSNSTLNCNMEVGNLNLNSEFVSFELFMNVSNQNENLNFILSSNNITYVYLKEPIQLLIPEVITRNFLKENFTLNFENALGIGSYSSSVDNFKVKLKPEYLVENPSKYLDCDFSKMNPTCRINNLSLSHTPMRIDYELEAFTIDFISNNLSFLIFNMTSNYYRENVTFLSEKPFIVDSKKHLNLTANITFKIDKKLHSDYSFYCKLSSDTQKIQRDAFGSMDTFSCGFLTNGVEGNVSISLHLNNTSIQGLSSSISNQDSTIEVVSLKLVPEFTTSIGFQNATIKKLSKSLVLPKRYQDFEYSLQFNQNPTLIDCFIQDNTIVCKKNPMVHSMVNDIFFSLLTLNYKQGSVSNSLIDINQPWLFFENHEISSVIPRATLLGSDINATITFDSRTLKTDSNIKDIQYFCEFPNGNSSMASKQDDLTILCPIEFDQHRASAIQLKSFFKAPSISGEKKVYLTVNQSNTKIHYLTKKDISFSNLIQLQFFYTSTNVSFKVNITTFIPNELTSLIKTRLSDSGYSKTTQLVTNVGNTFEFESSTVTSSGGRKFVSLWYQEGNYEFQISNNTLDLIFAVPSLITGISPTAVIVNRTTSVIISTAFETNLDYANANFVCKYGKNESKYSESSIANADQFGNFQCNVISDKEVKIFVSVWMNVKGVERKITIIDESLNVIDSNYFNPSIGLVTGNQAVKILEYNSPVSNVTFKDSLLNGKHIFTCEKVNVSLHCITPIVSKQIFSTFQSYELSFTSIPKNLSVPWIYYENTEISDFYPKFIASNVLQFNINISLNNIITINEGSLFFVFSPSTNERKDYDLGLVQNKNFVQKDIQPFNSETEGIYSIQMFYKNFFSLEFRSMFSISSTRNITFVSKSSIELISETNLFKINTLSNITVKFNQISKLYLSNSEKSSIKCKLGNTYLMTIMKSSDEFICTLESWQIKTQSISMFYVNENAFGKEILLSSNALDIIFFGNQFLFSQ